MTIEEKNRLQQLEDRVKTLEAELKNKTSKDDANREFQARMSSYQDDIRSEQGKVVLKKNFQIRNRGALTRPNDYKGLNPTVDNVITMSFNDIKESRLNHIFLGHESRAGNYNCSVIGATAIHKKDVPLQENGLIIPNNGRIDLNVIDEDYLDSDGVNTSQITPNIAIYPTGQVIPGGKGIRTQMFGNGEDGGTVIGHFTDAGNLKFIFVSKNNIYISDLPTSDPGEEGALWKDGTTLKISNG